MNYLIRINNQTAQDKELLHELHLLGLKKINFIAKSKIYRIEGEITPELVEFITQRLLVDPIIETFEINPRLSTDDIESAKINIWYKPSVLDIVSQNIKKAVTYLGIETPIHVCSGTQILLKPKISRRLMNLMSTRLLMNELIQYADIVVW